MNGYDYRKAVETHKGHIEETVLRGYLEEYRKQGVTFIRDGGDDLGVSSFVKTIVPEYGIDYRTPAFAIHKNGCYGSIVGKARAVKLRVWCWKRSGSRFCQAYGFRHCGFFKDMELSHRRRLPGKMREFFHIAHERYSCYGSFNRAGRETPRNVERTASNTGVDEEAIEAMARNIIRSGFPRW